LHIFKKRQNKKWLWIIYNRPERRRQPNKDKAIDFDQRSAAAII
jgi:hypothetical protein